MTPEKKYLKELVKAITVYLEQIDRLMMNPPADKYELGKRIAKLSNALEMSKDSARFFGLGERAKRTRQDGLRKRASP